MIKNLILIVFLISSSPNLNSETKMTNTNNNELSILTFNAGLFELNLFGFPIIKPADFLNERLESLPDELINSNADVIGLQEVYLKSHQDFILEKLKEDYPYFAYQRNKSIKINNGLMILSKFPLTNIKYYPFKERGPVDERIAAQKGILTAEVNYNNNESFLLVNIHPTSGGFLNKQDSEKILNIRKKQISQAMNIANKINKESIILGDFNTGPEIAKENYDILLNNGFVDSYLEYTKKTNSEALITWDNKNFLNETGTHTESISQRIDHIFLSSELFNKSQIQKSVRSFDIPNVIVENRKVTISDHYGIQTLITF